MLTMERVEAALLSRFKTSEAQKGTLLLDTLIAMAILAIIFSIAYPNYAYARSQSQVAASGQQMNAIASALEMYANDNAGQYPATGAINSSMFGANNPYLSSSPLSPLSGTAYTLTTAAQTNGSAGYTIKDPSVYAATALNSYKKIDGTSCAGGCTTLFYSNSQGLYGG